MTWRDTQKYNAEMMQDRLIDQICPSCSNPVYRQHGVMQEVKEGVLTTRYTCEGRLCISTDYGVFTFASEQKR